MYDKLINDAKKVFKEKVTFVNDQYEAVKDADALVLLTEWPQFDSPDFSRLQVSMKGNHLFDMRNRWLSHIANQHGFNYFGVGRNYPLPKKAS